MARYINQQVIENENNWIMTRSWQHNDKNHYEKMQIIKQLQCNANNKIMQTRHKINK